MKKQMRYYDRSRHYVAEITGTHPKFKLNRVFLKDIKELSEDDNASGSQGKRYYELEEGKYYELLHTNDEKYIVLIQDGEEIRVEMDEVIKHFTEKESQEVKDYSHLEGFEKELSEHTLEVNGSKINLYDILLDEKYGEKAIRAGFGNYTIDGKDESIGQAVRRILRSHDENFGKYYDIIEEVKAEKLANRKNRKYRVEVVFENRIVEAFGFNMGTLEIVLYSSLNKIVTNKELFKLLVNINVTRAYRF